MVQVVSNLSPRKPVSKEQVIKGKTGASGIMGLIGAYTGYTAASSVFASTGTVVVSSATVGILYAVATYGAISMLEDGLILMALKKMDKELEGDLKENVLESYLGPDLVTRLEKKFGPQVHDALRTLAETLKPNVKSA